MVTAVTTTNSHQQDTKNAENPAKINDEPTHIENLKNAMDTLESAGPEVQNLFRVLFERTDKMQESIDNLNRELQGYQHRSEGSSKIKKAHPVNTLSEQNIHHEKTELVPDRNDIVDVFGSGKGSVNATQQNINQTFSANNQYMNHNTGFMWGNYSQIEPVLQPIETNRTKKRSRQSWNERYKQLLEFKRTHNHCDVPQTEETGLGIWLSNQRGHYKMYVNGKPSCMTDEKKTMLDALGVTWFIRSKRVSWDERYKELKAFSLAHGHCEVSNSPAYSKLYIWIQNQRTAYKNLKQGKQSSLTPEKLKELESIGFNWLFKKDRVN